MKEEQRYAIKEFRAYYDRDTLMYFIEYYDRLAKADMTMNVPANRVENDIGLDVSRLANRLLNKVGKSER